MCNKFGIEAMVKDIIPNAMHNGRTIDQIIKVELKGGSILYIFDYRCLISRCFLNKKLLLNIEILIFEIKKIDCNMGIQMIEKTGVGEICGIYRYLDGLYCLETRYGLFILSRNKDNEKYRNKKVLIKGRFDLEGIKETN